MVKVSNIKGSQSFELRWNCAHIDPSKRSFHHLREYSKGLGVSYNDYNVNVANKGNVVEFSDESEGLDLSSSNASSSLSELYCILNQFQSTSNFNQFSEYFKLGPN